MILAYVLGLEGIRKRKFIHGIDELEKKILNDSVVSKITAELYDSSWKILKELRFSPEGVLQHEVLSALENKLLGDRLIVGDDGFWKEYSDCVIFAEDGLVSANKKDITDGNACSNYDNVRREIQDKIVQEYSKKLKFLNEEQIKNKLF